MRGERKLKGENISIEDQIGMAALVHTCNPGPRGAAAAAASGLFPF